MNKLIIFIKYIVFIISILFICLFINRYGLLGNNDFEFKMTVNLILLFLLIISIIIINVWDDKKSKELCNSRGYNLVLLLDLFSIIMIFGRTIFDKSILSNAINNYYGYLNIYGYKYCLFYSNFIILLLAMNIVYIFVIKRK